MKYDIYLFRCSSSIVSLFMQELQKGIHVHSYEGETIYSFLTEHCFLSDEYIARKVKTIFIDGGPVDDIFNTRIKDGGVCALSGAMPGIVGAMMRMGSPYASMRANITVTPDKSVESEKEIDLHLKLFNTILSDKGIDFLKRGILIEKKRVYDLFFSHGEELYHNCREILLNDITVKEKFLSWTEDDCSEGLVLLKIELDDESKS